MQGLEPVLNSSTNGLIVKSSGDMDYHRRCKLARIAVKLAIQNVCYCHPKNTLHYHL